MSFSLVPINAREIREDKQKTLRLQNKEEIKTFEIQETRNKIGEGIINGEEW